ncbi:MAG TPA: Gfo/Idh/MocA family oxidoreductase, partial [Caulifigura sp.]|nr:Gfo/Idh/MocA family oxidoreductase [Caulifigura sp.]
RPAPSERIRIGFVGLGGRGTQVLKDFLPLPDAQIVALCDVQAEHYRELPAGKGPKLGSLPAKELVDKAELARGGGTGRACIITHDYRELVGLPDLDAVVVATPDHWHAQITLDALRAGKDVYCEKPVTHLFAEGQLVYREVAARKAVFQTGSQQRSAPEFQQAVELVRNGHLGQIRSIEIGLENGYSKPMGSTDVVPIPPGLDYDRWCGPSPVLPYMNARHHRWWRGNRAYGGGVLMDWIGHHNDIAHWGIGQELGGPTKVAAVGWTMPDFDIYDTPIDYEMACDYPGGITSRISTKVTGGTKWIGDDGWLWVNRGKIKASNPKLLAKDFDHGPWKAGPQGKHAANFLACVRSREACIAPAEQAHRSITPGHLGYVSHALKRPLKWDPLQEQIVGDSQAQTLLMTMTYRPQYAIKA